MARSDSDEFDKADLDIDVLDALKKVETKES